MHVDEQRQRRHPAEEAQTQIFGGAAWSTSRSRARLLALSWCARSRSRPNRAAEPPRSSRSRLRSPTSSRPPPRGAPRGDRRRSPARGREGGHRGRTGAAGSVELQALDDLAAAIGGHRGGREPGRGGRRLGAVLLPGGTDGEDGQTRGLHRGRHQRGDTARRRDEGRETDHRDQQGCGRPDLPARRSRRGRGRARRGPEADRGDRARRS